jgi:hypothetical protein
MTLAPIATKADLDAVIRALARGGDCFSTDEEVEKLIGQYEDARILVALFELMRADRVSLRWNDANGRLLTE